MLQRVYTALDDDRFSSWLEVLDSPARPRFRLIFIDEDSVSTEKLCITSVLMRKIFHKFKISSHFASSLRRFQSPARNLYVEGEDITQRYEFWYVTVLKSEPKQHSISPSKRVLGWSFMTVWTATDFTIGTTTLLVTRLPLQQKHHLLHESSGFWTQMLGHPMLIHLHLLRTVVENHGQTSGNLLRTISREEASESRKTLEYTKLSERFLLICRQLTSFIIDSDLVQGVIQRVIEENTWVADNWPYPKASDQAALWKRHYASIDQELRRQLANLKIYGRYARVGEDRARIGIDECRAAISQHDAENNLSLAEESKMIADAAKADSRSLTKLQYLAMITLPLSLSSSIFGMGFFSTSTGPSGDAQLLVSSRWWWYLALAIPMTALTVLSLYGLVAWEAIKNRNRKPLVQVNGDKRA